MHLRMDGLIILRLLRQALVFKVRTVEGKAHCMRTAQVSNKEVVPSLTKNEPQQVAETRLIWKGLRLKCETEGAIQSRNERPGLEHSVKSNREQGFWAGKMVRMILKTLQACKEVNHVRLFLRTYWAKPCLSRGTRGSMEPHWTPVVQLSVRGDKVTFRSGRYPASLQTQLIISRKCSIRNPPKFSNSHLL